MSEKGESNDNNDTLSHTLKFHKSLTRMSQKISYAKIRSQKRLAGGADAKSQSSESGNKLAVDTEANLTPATSGTLEFPAAQEEIETIVSEPISCVVESTGDKKVDEIIDYVIRNLQEAGKALASLGENFEHNLKLLLVDLMSKVQSSVSLAQIRQESARTDLESLRKELISRLNELASKDREIAELKVKLADSEIAKGAYERALSEKVRSDATIPASPSTSAIRPLQHDFAGVISSQRNLPSPEPSQSARSPTAFSHPTESDEPLTAQPESTENALSYAQSHEVAENSNQRTARPLTDLPPIDSSGSQSFGLPIAPQLRRTEEPTTVDAAVQFRKGKEKRRRESELEAEVDRLRKENEKILKERTEYENAIQRALLRGVSSLNAETLKVLRCPPAVCHTPRCPPPSPTNTVEEITPRVPKLTRDNWTPQVCQSKIRNIRSRVKSDAPVSENDQGSSDSKRVTTTCNDEGSTMNNNSPTTKDPTVVLLLHKSDATKVCIPKITGQCRSHNRGKMQKRETSVCRRKA